MQATFERDSRDPRRVTLRNVRVAYAQGLNTPTSMTPAPGQAPGAPKFNAAFLFPATATDIINGIQQVMWDACVAEFKDQATAVFTELQASNKLALKNGATKASQEGFLDHFFVSPSAKADRPPALFHKYLKPDGSGVQELARPQNVIYSGCYVNVQLSFWAQNNNYGRRVNCEMLAVQFAEDGESYGGGASADTSVFGGVAAPAGQSGLAAAPATPSFAAPAAGPAPAAVPAPAAPTFAAPAAQGAPGFAPAVAGPVGGVPAVAAPAAATPVFTPPGFAPAQAATI